MRGIHIAQPGTADSSAAPPGPVIRGDLSEIARGPDGSVLWLRRLRLADGAAILWDPPHGEEAVHVVAGTLEVDGRRAPAGGALVLEGAARSEAVALGSSEVVLFGRRDQGGDLGTAVHVVGPGGTHAVHDADRVTRFFADSRCPTCSVTLFETGRTGTYESSPHSHSADELIHVLEGEIHVGRTVLGPGATLAVAADRRYGFRSPGFRFLNYRPGRSVLSRAGGATPLDEGPDAAGLPFVGDLR